MASRRKQLILRVKRNDKAITLTAGCEVGEIEVNETALRRVFNKDLSDQDHHNVFTIHWDSRNPNLDCVLNLENEDEIGVISKLVQNKYTLLHRLIILFYEEFKGKIIYVYVKPLRIGVTHDSEKDWNDFESHVLSGAVKTTFQNLLKISTVLEVRTSDGHFPTAERDLQELQKGHKHGRKQDKDSENVHSHQNNPVSEVKIKKSKNYETDFEHRQAKDDVQDVQRLVQRTDDREVYLSASQSDDIGGKSPPEQLHSAKARVLGLRPPLPNQSTQSVMHAVLSGGSSVTENADSKCLGQLCRDADIAHTKPSIGQQATSRQESPSFQETLCVKELPYHQEKSSDQDTSNEGVTVDQQEQANTYQSANTGTTPDTPTNTRRDVHQTLKHLNKGDTSYLQATSDIGSIPDLETISVLDFSDVDTPNDLGTPSAEGSIVYQRSCFGQQKEQPTERTIVIDRTQHPKCKGVDTVFILNTTMTLGQQGLEQLKQIVTFIVNGIEELAINDQELEENFAVVVFGEKATILLQATYDYGAIVETIADLSCGGETPLLDALELCQASLHGIGSLTISRVHKVLSRYIIITDGREGHISNKQELISHLRKNAYTKQSLLVWIPVGQADMTYLEALASLSQGKLVDGTNEHQLSQLSRYQRTQITVGRMFRYVNENPHLGHDTFENWMSTLINIFLPDAIEVEKEEIIDTLKHKIDRHDGCGNLDQTENDEQAMTDLKNSLPLGIRVSKGPDWDYQKMDWEGLGTVYEYSKNQQGMLWVKWDNNQLYEHRFGHDNAYDVWPVEDKPRNLLVDKPLDGCKEAKSSTVVWKWQDGDNNWHPYTHDVSVKLEQNFSSRHRSCLIQRGGKSYRVIFKDNVEIDTTDKSSRHVTRTFVEN